MRKCEKCHGPGPCLWDPRNGRYLCKECHSEPTDSFFSKYDDRGEEPREKKCPADIDFWEWLEIVTETSDWQPTEHQKRLWDFFSGKSTEDVKLVIASPRRTRTYQLIGARMLTKPWDNHRSGHVDVEIGDDIKAEPCETKLVPVSNNPAFSGRVQVHVDDLVETYPEGCEVIKAVAEKAEAEKEKMIDYLLQRQKRGAGQSVSVQKTLLSPGIIPRQRAEPADPLVKSLEVTEDEKGQRVARLQVKMPEIDYRESAAVLLGVSPDQIGPLSVPCDIEDCVEPIKGTFDGHLSMAEVTETPEEKARRLASEAYHDHPSNPSDCPMFHEQFSQPCPCEDSWRDFLEGEDDE